MTCWYWQTFKKEIDMLVLAGIQKEIDMLVLAGIHKEIDTVDIGRHSTGD